MPRKIKRVLPDRPAVPEKIADTAALEQARAKMETVIEAQDRLAEEIKARQERLIREVATIDKRGNIVWDEPLCVYGAMIGYTTLIYLAERGDREAAKTLFMAAAGQPEQPLRIRLETEGWSGDDALNEMYRVLTQDRQLSDQMARAQILLMTGLELPALPAAVREEEGENG